MSTRRNPTHEEHQAALASYRARGGPLWAGPTDEEIDASWAEWWREHPRPARCAARCGTPLDPVLLAEGWTMHPSCEFPELRMPRVRPGRPA